MNERLLQFIWQFQYFNKGELCSTGGELIHILTTGQYNTNQGADFINAMIRIGNTTWAGSVELHLKTSDWNRHHHQQDKNYQNVILHVVWEDDSAVNDIPLLVLKGRVSNLLLKRYEELMHAPSFIPCLQGIATVNEITWRSWKDRLLAERLLRKSTTVETCLLQNNHHWEETCWWLLARNFGMKVNADAFEAIARSIPISILAKHKSQVIQLEALLLGQAGLLQGKFTDDYPVLLQREYRFLKEKYQLAPVHQPIHFLRMRPENFPTIRLAQLAMLINGSVHLFAKIKETVSSDELRKYFECTANDYWHYHYRFDELTTFKKKRLGAAMIDNILINTIAPLLFAYGNYYQEEAYKQKALQWLEETAAETNTITSKFSAIAVKNKNGFDSQALIEMKNEYCDKRRCLDCSVGNSLLRSATG